MKHVYYLNGKRASEEIALRAFDPQQVSVFETLRVYHGQIFREREHLQRLEESARTVGGKPSFDLEKISKEIRLTVKNYGRDDATLRITWNPAGLLVMIGERRLPRAAYEAGIDLRTSPVRRSLSNASPPEAKTTDYMNAVLATLEPQLCHSEARRAEESQSSEILRACGAQDDKVTQGAQDDKVTQGVQDNKVTQAFEWLFLDQQGYVTEVRIGNIFIAETGRRAPRLRTPPLRGILNGVTRRFVIECALLEGIEVREEPLTRHEVYNASEVFLTNTSWEILPVRSLDGRLTGRTVPGALTLRLHEIFKKRVRQECPPSKSKGR